MSDDGLKTVYKAYNVLPKPCGDEKSIGTFYGKIASIQGRVEPFQKTEDGYDSKYKFVPRAVLQTRYHDEMKKENLWVKKGLGDVFEATFHGEKRLFAQFYYIVGDTSGNSSRTDTYIMLDGYIHKYDSAGKRYLRSVQGTHEIAIAVSWGERVAMRLFWGYAEQDDEAPPISKEVPLTQEDLASEGKLKVIVLNDNAKKYWRGNVDKLVKIESDMLDINPKLNGAKAAEIIGRVIEGSKHSTIQAIINNFDMSRCIALVKYDMGQEV